MVLDSGKGAHISMIKKRQREILFLLSKRDTTFSPENSGERIWGGERWNKKEADIGEISTNDQGTLHITIQTGTCLVV